MNINASTSRAEATALARFAFISKIQELLRTPVPLQTALATVAGMAFNELTSLDKIVAPAHEADPARTVIRQVIAMLLDNPDHLRFTFKIDDLKSRAA